MDKVTRRQGVHHIFTSPFSCPDGATDISLKIKGNGSIRWKTNYTCVSMRLSLSKHNRTRICLFTPHFQPSKDQSQITVNVPHYGILWLPFHYPTNYLYHHYYHFFITVHYSMPKRRWYNVPNRNSLFYFLGGFFVSFLISLQMSKFVSQFCNHGITLKKPGRVLRCFI